MEAAQQFSCSAAGGVVPYAYQWYYANGTAISGATTSGLTYKANQTGTFSIYVNVTDSLSSRVKSNIVIINVYSKPSVTISPTSVSMTVGTQKTFTSTTTGGLTPYTYQWYYTNGTAITGGTTSTLTFNANRVGTYNIYLNATDSLNYRAKSNIATVNVYSQPSVTISPTSVNMIVNITQQFSSTVAGGLAPYTYQWYYANGTSILGATASTLMYTPNSIGVYSIYLSVTDSLNYRVQSNVATINVYPALAVSVNPVNDTLYYGGSVTFTTSASGGAPGYGYQWYLNGNAVSGANGPTWMFTPEADGTWNVYVYVTDSLNNQAQSMGVSVNVYSANLVLTVDQSQPILTKGQSVIFDVDVFNQFNPALKSSLTLTVTSLGSYGYFDVQPINVPANTVREYTFSWTVPLASGTYVVEVGLSPAQLTAYDTVWLKVD